MKMKRTLFNLIMLLSIAAILPVESALPAETDFFEGKTVVVYVGRPPGSGADLAVRSFVRYWQKHIPGEPTLVVKNVSGGAGSRVWNLAWDNKRPDALAIYFSPVSGTALIVGEPGLRADLSKMTLVGALQSPNMTFARADRLKEAADLPNVKGLVFGGQAPAHRFSLLGRLSLDILGVEYRNVSGFRGSSDVFNAMRRKEVDIQTAPLNFYRFTVEPGLVKSGDVIPLWYNPVIDDKGKFVPLEAAGDIPSFMEYYESVNGTQPTGELFEMYKWLLPKINGIVYAAFLAPGTPALSGKILSDSFIRVTQDAEYRAEEKKMFGFNLPPVSHALGTQIISDMTNAPENIKTFLNDYIQEAR